jgi:hypothetical protein
MSGLFAGDTSGIPAPFAVTAPPDVKLGPTRTGTTTFTVTNLTGRPLRARMIPRGRGGAADSWMAVVGDAEIPMGVAATVTVDIAVTVPVDAPGGQHLLVLEVVPEDDTETVIGQSVSFTAPPPKPVEVQKQRPWLRILLIILFSLLALIGLAVVVLIIAILVAAN